MMESHGTMDYSSRVTPIAGTFHHYLKLSQAETENFTSPDSIKCWKVCGNIQDQKGTDEMSAKYFHPFTNGTQTRTACFGERSAWKCMENWYNRSACQGTWIILGEVSWQFHTEKDKINDQTPIPTFPFWVGSWKQRMEQQRTNSSTFLPSLQLKSPGTGDASFAGGQSGSTSFDKQGYTVSSGTHSC